MLTRSMQRRLDTIFCGGLGAVALSAIPLGAAACPVCFAAEQRQLWAYFGTAVLLSLLPFLLFAGIVLWIRLEGRRAGQSANSQPEAESSSIAQSISPM